MKTKYKFSLRNKLFLSYFLLILLTVFCLYTFFFHRSAELLKAQAKNWNITSLDQAQSLLSAKIDHLSYVLESAVSNDSVQRIVKRNKSLYTFSDQIDDALAFEQMASNIKNNNPIVDVKMYVSNVRYSNQNSAFFDLSQLQQTSLYNRLLFSKDKIYWAKQDFISGSTNVFSAYLCIRNPNQHQVVEAVLRLDFLKEDIYTILSQAIQNTGGSILLLNEEIDQLASVEENDKLGFSSQNKDFWGIVQQYGYQWEQLKIDKETVYTSSRKIKNTDWHLIALIPRAAVIRETNTLQNQVMLLCAMFLVSSILVVSVLSRLIVRRLEHLRYAMNQVQNGNWKVKVSIKGSDEISGLKDDFDYMLFHIRRLSEEKIAAISKLKDAELLALQSQINPHFLYNSLDSINWMAFSHDAPEIQKLVSDLAKFYRIALSEGNIIIPVLTEIDHVRMYVNVQNIRYENQIAFSTKLDDLCQLACIPKITLQPIVENAILHGIMKRSDKSGNISISAKKEGDILLLCVEDNGVGIPLEKLATLLQHENSTSYGLKNVDLRLKKYYGNNFGLSFSSSSKGTLVTVKIPFNQNST